MPRRHWLNESKESCRRKRMWRPNTSKRGKHSRNLRNRCNRSSLKTIEIERYKLKSMRTLSGRSKIL